MGIEDRESNAEGFVNLLDGVAEEIFPEQNSVSRSRERYVAELIAGNKPDYWCLEYGGVVRMGYHDGKLIPIDKSWGLDSRIIDGTLREHWQQIEDDYHPKAKEFMEKLGLE